jgi:hypothetical protein
MQKMEILCNDIKELCRPFLPANSKRLHLYLEKAFHLSFLLITSKTSLEPHCTFPAALMAQILAALLKFP